MVSNLEKLSSALRTVGNPEKDEAQRLVEKIKSDPQIQDELRRSGLAHVRDDAGRGFVVKRKVAEAAVAGR
jgi:hypothetical protein